MEKLSASQQQQIKKMADERLRTKLVVGGYEEELVWSWDREELISRYAELLLEGAKPKVAPAPVDPALERERLAFEMKRWEAEQEQKRLQQEEETRRWESEQHRREEEKQRWEAEQEEKKQKLDFEKMKAEQDHQRWMADRYDKRRQEQAEEMRREAEQGRQDAVTYRPPRLTLTFLVSEVGLTQSKGFILVGVHHRRSQNRLIGILVRYGEVVS